MGRSALFSKVTRALRLAQFCNQQTLSTAEGLERVREMDVTRAVARHTRREWLKTVAHAGAAGAAAAAAVPAARLLAAPPTQPLSVGIVGGGLAGLACADELARSGLVASVYDAASRTGGRCWSLRGVFPGQVAERGGEFIDNLHKTMIGYARRYGVALEDVNKEPGEIVYYFGGRHISESAVVDEFREFVDAMRFDLRRVSGAVTAFSHNGDDVDLDRTNLLAYLEGANGAGISAGSIAKAALAEAYVAEYGLEPDQQSCLNLLLFIHADRRSKFTPFGVFSDERYHVVDGNDRIVEGLTQDLPRPVEHGMQLLAVSKTSAGTIRLTFRAPSGASVERTHDAAVLAVPFSTLRDVHLDVTLGLSPEKRAAIDLLGYGTNAKLMVGYQARPWRAHGGNGGAYADLPNLQTTWETNPARATAGRAILTDYSGGDRGASIDPNDVQTAAGLFVAELDRVFPGAQASVRREDGHIVAHLEHWPSHPLTRGSYTCYRPGQFTTIAGLEGQPAGNLFFAGEHTNSFHEWQGFMEGAVLSGIDAAAGILRHRRLLARR